MNNMVIEARSDSVHHVTGVEYFDPDKTLITPLRRAIANAQDMVLKLNGVGELILFSSQGEYFHNITDESAFFSAPVEMIEISILSGSARRIYAEQGIGRNIDELMWKVGHYCSGGRLMEGCYPVDMVELTYWPNLTRLPHTPNSMRIAALLSRHPASIAFVARLLKISAEEIYQFYSAASCAGHARPVNRVPVEPKLEPHRHQTLLSALLKKLAAL